MWKTLRSTLMENSWFPRKPLVFHRTIPDTKDLTLYSSSSMSKTLQPTLMENSWFPRKPLVFHRTIPDTKDLTSYSSSSMSETLWSTLMGTSWYLSKSMFFWPLRTDKQASKQADNLCLQDSSLREREHWRLNKDDSSSITWTTKGRPLLLYRTLYYIY